MYYYFFFCRFYVFYKKIVYDFFGDKMNGLEIYKLLSKMKKNIKIANRSIQLISINKGLGIDKPVKK